MAHNWRISGQLVAMTVVAVACSGSDQSRSAEGGGATDSAALAATAAPTELRVSSVMIGRQVGAGNRITEPTFEFKPKDTVHVSVGTTGTGEGGPLTAAWRSQTGEILLKSSEPVTPGENADFQLSQAKGLRPGTYKVILFLGEDSVDTKVFVVKK
jgi:hypothetical protein